MRPRLNIFLRTAAATTGLLIYLCGFTPRLDAQVLNYWPLFVGEGEGQPEGESARAFGRDFQSWSAAGPIVFQEQTNDLEVRGVRPFWVKFTEPTSGEIRGHVLYPLFNYRIDGEFRTWNLFYIINSKSDEETEEKDFMLFPFIFSRNTGNPETSHFGIFPIAGTVKAKFGNGQIDWALFPLYGKFQENNVTTLTVPWPFIKILSGEGNHGFEFWPFYGTRHKEGAYREKFVAFPFYITRDQKLWLEEPEETRMYFPYFRQTTALFDNKSYVWPFFGRTISKYPEYDAKRYFWPLFVQIRGKYRYVNRWAPFYGHSIRKGIDKTWVMWPFYRQQIWNENDLDQTKTQFLYFLYWKLTQRHTGESDGPVARKTHVWPLFTDWDNGAGTRQFQLFSPFEVFFPFNRSVRSIYSPFFAIYRSEKIGDDFARSSFFFNFITYRREAENVQTDIGPLVGWGSGENSSHFSVLKGLLGYERKEGHRRFRLLWIPIGPDQPATAQGHFE